MPKSHKPGTGSKEWNGVGVTVIRVSKLEIPQYWCRRCEEWGHPEDSHLDRHQFDKRIVRNNIQTGDAIRRILNGSE
jgi:hypothetical protein